ncbi:hypothetical protein BH10PSE17_BH10PSE17_04450 [soil metagenome]
MSNAAVDTYGQLFEGFRWAVPERLNMARECCDRWADDPDRVAMLRDGANGIESITYRELRDEAARLAAWLRGAGIQRGQIVAIATAQRAETAVAHMAILACGAIVLPMSILFGPEAFEYRLDDSKAVAIIADEHGVDGLQALLIDAIEPSVRIAIGAPVAGWTSWDAIQRGPAPAFEIVDTASSDAALLIYTSGTTGNPKGALIPQSAMLGNLSGFVASQNWFPQGEPSGRGDVFWSPADWAWTGGLWDALLPSLYFGMPIVAADGKVDNRFSAERAFEIIEQFGVTNVFLFPTALKSMMKAVPDPHSRYRLRLRAIMSAGEPVGAAVYDWCEQRLKIRLN